MKNKSGRNTFFKKEEKTTTNYEDGRISTVTCETSGYFKNNEPEFIKIYESGYSQLLELTNPIYCSLFMFLATHMTYCDTANHAEHGGQIIYTGKPFSDHIRKKFKWSERMLYVGLDVLCKAGALRKIKRGAYQVNPKYAGRGEYKFNAKLERGGIEDLSKSFNVDDGEVKNEIIYADNGESTKYNDNWRTGLGVKASDDAVLKRSTVTSN